MPKWLLNLLLILVLAIVATHFVSPGAIPDWLAIAIMAPAIAVIVVFVAVRRQKELQEIRDELQRLRQEVEELKKKQP